VLPVRNIDKDYNILGYSRDSQLFLFNNLGDLWVTSEDRTSHRSLAWQRTYTAKGLEFGSRIKTMLGYPQRFFQPPKVPTISSSSYLSTNAARCIWFLSSRYSTLISWNYSRRSPLILQERRSRKEKKVYHHFVIPLY
jgi:hypothetical protein